VSIPKEWYETDEMYIAPWQLEEMKKQNAEFIEQADLPLASSEKQGNPLK